MAIRTGSDYYDVKHGSLAAVGSPWALVASADLSGVADVAEMPTSGGFPPAAVASLVAAAESLADELYPA